MLIKTWNNSTLEILAVLSDKAAPELLSTYILCTKRRYWSESELDISRVRWLLFGNCFIAISIWGSELKPLGRNWGKHTCKARGYTHAFVLHGHLKPDLRPALLLHFLNGVYVFIFSKCCFYCLVTWVIIRACSLTTDGDVENLSMCWYRAVWFCG